MSAQTRHEVHEAEREVVSRAKAYVLSRNGYYADLQIAVMRLTKAERADRKSERLPPEFHVVKRGHWGLALVSLKGKPSWRRGLGARWSKEDAERFAEAFGGRTEVAF